MSLKWFTLCALVACLCISGSLAYEDVEEVEQSYKGLVHEDDIIEGEEQLNEQELEQLNEQDMEELNRLIAQIEALERGESRASANDVRATRRVSRRRKVRRGGNNRRRGNRRGNNRRRRNGNKRVKRV